VHDYKAKVITIVLPGTTTKISIEMQPGISVRKVLSDYCLTVDSDSCEYFVDMFNAAYYGIYIAPYTDSDPFYDMFTIRSDVLVYLQEIFHYHSYLEIGCHSNNTFNIVKNIFQIAIGVDPNQGGTHRMTSDQFFATNQLTFDVIFIDGLHHSEQVAKDIENALRVLNPGGTIVMHDCNPTTKVSQLRMGDNRDEERRGFTVDWWRDGTNHWNGDTWRAILPLRLRDDLEIVIGDFDSGVGVLRQRRNTHRLEREHEEMLVTSSDPLQAFSYEFFDKHRLQLHRLLSFKNLQSWLLLDYDDVMRKQSNIPSMDYFVKVAVDRYHDESNSTTALRLVIINNDERVQLRMVDTFTGYLNNSFDIELLMEHSYQDIIIQSVESCRYLVISDNICEDILKIGLLKLYELKRITHGSMTKQLTRYSFCSFIEQPSNVLNALQDSIALDTDLSLQSLHRLFMPHTFDVDVDVDVDVDLISIEDSIVSTIILSSTTTLHQSIQRVCIIHSVRTSFLHDLSRLVDVLSSLELSGLMVELGHVIVLNYGIAVDELTRSRYPHVLWMQVCEDDSYFEVPTMRIIHKVATDWYANGIEVQLLYLNVEVMRQQQQLRDDIISDARSHRNVQLHHLVFRHKTNYYLLSSGEFDCVGLHYTHKILPRFEENQWWCLSSYIAQLPILTYESSRKEEPSYWLFASEHRVHSLDVHGDRIRHANSSSSSSSSSSIDYSEAFNHCLKIVR